MEYQSATDSIFSSNQHSTSNLADNDASTGPQSVVGRGGSEITYSGGQATFTRDTVTQINSSDAFINEGDLLSTARSPSGGAVVGRPVAATDIVSYGGMEMTVAMAESFGWVSRTASVGKDGQARTSFTATEQGNSGMTQKDASGDGVQLSDGPKQTAEGAAAFAADEATETLMGQIIGTTQADTQISALNSYMRTGTIDAQVVERMASQMGIEPDEAANSLVGVEAGMGAAILSHLSKFGVHNEEAFTSFIHSDNRTVQELNEALRNLMTANSMSGFEKLATKFQEKVADYDPEAVIDALEASGWTWRQSSEGTLMVETNKFGEITFEAAVKAGIIRFSK